FRSAAVVVLEVTQARVEARRVDVVVHVQALEVLLDRRVPDLVDHLDRLAVVQFRVRDDVEQHRHRAGGRDLRQRDDRQEQLLPLQPALLDLTEHVAADGAVLGAVHPVVLLLFHRAVGPEDLLERVLLGSLAEGVVGLVLHVRLVVLGLPGELLDLLMSLRQTLQTHVTSSRWWVAVIHDGRGRRRLRQLVRGRSRSREPVWPRGSDHTLPPGGPRSQYETRGSSPLPMVDGRRGSQLALDRAPPQLTRRSAWPTRSRT